LFHKAFKFVVFVGNIGGETESQDDVSTADTASIKEKNVNQNLLANSAESYQFPVLDGETIYPERTMDEESEIKKPKKTPKKARRSNIDFFLWLQNMK